MAGAAARCPRVESGKPPTLGPRTLGAAEQPPPRVLQTGGHTIKEGTRKTLGLTREEMHKALTLSKTEWGQGARDHFHKIMSNGDVFDSNTGQFLGNLYEFLQ